MCCVFNLLYTPQIKGGLDAISPLLTRVNGNKIQYLCNINTFSKLKCKRKDNLSLSYCIVGQFLYGAKFCTFCRKLLDVKILNYRIYALDVLLNH